ncbi:hypothetical protein ACVWW3_006369 [Bradyrhizobium sp. LM2.9]
MPARTRSWVARRLMSRPSKASSPFHAGSSPTMVFINVVLPAPLRPSTATPPRQGMPRLTSNRTWLRP